MDNIREKLYYKIIDFVFDEYDAQTQTKEDKQKNIVEFRERLTQWKIDFNYRKIIGPLQTAEVLSRIKKIPVSSVKQVAKEVGTILPSKVNVKEFSLEKLSDDEVDYYLSSEISEETFLELISVMEAPREEFDIGEPFVPNSFEFIDMTSSNTEYLQLVDIEETSGDNPLKIHLIQYLENLIHKVKCGDLYNMGVVALMNDGNANIFVPKKLEDSDSQKIIDALIGKLKDALPATEEQ